MNIRLGTLGIKFLTNQENIPGIAILYFDGGLEFQIYKSIMRFDWGYYESEWRIYRSMK